MAGRFWLGVVGLSLFLGTPTSGGDRVHYHSSFEGTDGGWSADATWDVLGDWERGTPTIGPFPGCSFGNGPGAAFDGLECWATQIDACYTNANGTSFLRQTFDFTTVVNGTLSWRQFRHVFVQPGDAGAVKINGDTVYQLPFLNTASAGWEFLAIDLTPYSGLPSVEIVFEFFANASINGPGWFIDDVRITSLVDPNTDDLGILVVDSPDPVTRVGDPIVYSVTAINHSDAAASSVVVNGTLDNATVFNAGSSDSAVQHDGSPTGGDFSIQIGAMPAFSVQSFAVAVETTTLGTVTMSASIGGAAADPNPDNDSHLEQTDVALIADIRAALTSDQDPVITLTPFAYTVDITNHGPSDATGIAWQLTLPAETNFLGTTEGGHDGSASGGVVSGILAQLGAGLNHAVVVQASPLSGAAANLDAAASASLTSPDEEDPDPVNNDAALTVGHVLSAEPFARPLFTSSGLDSTAPNPLPTSIPPGISDRLLTFFQRPYVSPNGQIWGFIGDLESLSSANNQVVVLVTDGSAESVIYENVTALPDVPGDTVGNMSAKLSINDAGCYAFAPDSADTRLDVVVKGCGNNVDGTGTLEVVGRTNTTIPGDPQNANYLGFREAHIDNQGVIRMIARRFNTTLNATVGRIYATSDAGQSVNLLLEERVDIPAGQLGGGMAPWEFWDQEFQTRSGLQVTGDGMHMLLRGDLTGSTATDDILALNNAVVLQEGGMAHASFAAPIAEPAFGVYLAPNGDWYARGRNADNQEWVIRNGDVIARGGTPIFPGSNENWLFGSTSFSPHFQVVAADGQGNYVIGGNTTASTDGALVFYPAAALRGGGATPRVIARVGDPVDTDGNGLFDNKATIARFSGDGVVLLADGTVIALVSVGFPFPFAAPSTLAGSGTGSAAPAIAAIKVLNFSGACCLPTGECQDGVLELDCTAAGGQPFPGIPCFFAPCGIGACCTLDGCVDNVEATACESADPENEFQGDGTVCTNIKCGGACCIEDFALAGDTFCELTVSGRACRNRGGDYLGNGTVCRGRACEFCDSDLDCEDFDKCNGLDFCDDGLCVSTAAPEIDDGIDCTADSCNPDTGAVTHTPVDSLCSDGDACNGMEVCDPSVGCRPGSPLECDDGNPCTIDSCDPVTGCKHQPKDCRDAHACTIDLCDPATGQCLNIPQHSRCDDGIDCTIDTCDPGSGCLNGADHSQCDDGVFCTTDRCSVTARGCENTPNDAVCESADPCFVRHCDPVNDCVLDQNVCVACCFAGTMCETLTASECFLSAGTPLPAGVDCLPGGFCPNTTGACCTADGTGCTIVEPIICQASGGFFQGLGTRCDQHGECPRRTGACCRNGGPACEQVIREACNGVNDKYRGDRTICLAGISCPNACQSDADCDDNDVCNGQERCDLNSEECVDGTPLDCDDGDACTVDGCDPITGCLSNLRNCDDQNVCTFDFCDSVEGCKNLQENCDDGNACTFDGCTPGTGCVNTPVNCDDGNACTIDVCDPAVGCLYTTILCDDGDQCTADICDPAVGCLNFPVCPPGTACVGGTCQCSPPPGDLTGDARVTRDDLPFFVDCLFGPQGGLLPGCGCADVNGDGVVDLVDVERFMRDATVP